jgi:hypothetical protein
VCCLLISTYRFTYFLSYDVLISHDYILVLQFDGGYFPTSNQVIFSRLVGQTKSEWIFEVEGVLRCGLSFIW